MTDEELSIILYDLESDRVERKESFAEPDRIRQAICAFANDMPGHSQPGILFIGARDDGSGANLSITDQLLQNLAHVRDDGNIQPLPSMTVEKRVIAGCELAVVVVSPCDAPPVRYKGQIWIRVGPRRAIATPQEERQLSERRRAGDLPFDARPLSVSSVDDLNLDLFRQEYLLSALPPDVLDENQRTTDEQLTALRFLSPGPDAHPTVIGILTVGKSPSDLVPGAYVQFLRINGTDLAAPIADQKEIHGPLGDVLRRLDELIDANIRVGIDIESASTDIKIPDYPKVALQQLVRNAVMHRDYETSNAPVHLTWFDDRIEIQNPGGPFGQVTRDNFGQPGITDYRNPHVAEVMKALGFVQRFGVGIQVATKLLQENGNGSPEFSPQDSHVLVVIRRRS